MSVLQTIEPTEENQPTTAEIDIITTTPNEPVESNPVPKAKPKRKPRNIKHIEVVAAPTEYFDDEAPIEETVEQPVAKPKVKAKSKAKVKSKDYTIVKEPDEQPVEQHVEQPIAKPKSKGKKIVKEPIAEPITEPIAEPIAAPTESVKIKDKVKCPNCDKEMNAKTLSYNHKHICPKKPPEVVKDVKEDIEDIVVKHKNIY